MIVIEISFLFSSRSSCLVLVWDVSVFVWFRAVQLISWEGFGSWDLCSVAELAGICLIRLRRIRQMLTHFLEKRSYWTRFWTVQDCFLALTAHLCFVVSLFGALEEMFTSHPHILFRNRSLLRFRMDSVRLLLECEHKRLLQMVWKLILV